MTLWSDAKSNNYVVDIINESIYKWVFLMYVKKKKNSNFIIIINNIVFLLLQ